MMLAAVASIGERIPPVWFPEGLWLGADYYIEALKKTFRGSMTTPAPFFLQQDSTPAQHARKTIEYSKNEKKIVLHAAQWPPNSPDLNPMDYSIWSLVVQGPAVTTLPMCLL